MYSYRFNLSFQLNNIIFCITYNNPRVKNNNDIYNIAYNRKYAFSTISFHTLFLHSMLLYSSINPLSMYSGKYRYTLKKSVLSFFLRILYSFFRFFHSFILNVHFLIPNVKKYRKNHFLRYFLYLISLFCYNFQLLNHSLFLYFQVMNHVFMFL